MAAIDSKTRIKNAENLSKILKKLPDDVKKQIKKSMVNAVERTAKKADDDVAVLTGSLAGSINAKSVDGDEFRWGIYAKFYWQFVEFGTKKMPAQPFFMHHWRRARKTVKNSIKRNVKKKMKQKYGKR